MKELSMFIDESGDFGKDNKSKREIYVTDGEYTIYSIAEEDREYYVELHKQLNGESTLFLNPVCKDMMWEQVLSGKDKVFSIYDKSGEYCGSVELQHPDSNTPELGIDLMESKRNKGIATRAIKLVARRAYEDKRVDYFLIRISSRNPHSKHVFEKMGVIPLRTTESTFKTFMKDYRDVMKNTEVDDAMEERLKKIFDNADDLEEEVVYEYKLTSEMFL